ncbi:MAG: GGDEF domain-containing protein [Ruminococcus sp.]|nr:GGDEF domain-containing protein [Ruminococcus sp.]
MTVKPVDYIYALNDFNALMDNMPSVFHPDNDNVYKPICDVLGVSRIDVQYIDVDAEPAHGVIYGKYAKADGQSVSQLETAKNGATAEYTLYRSPSAPEWDEDDKGLISGFIKTVFIHHGRLRIMSMVERLTYFDPVMEIGNLKAFFRKISEIIENDHIAQYGACYFNLKRFSVVNRSFGRDNGTKIMKRFVKSLAAKLKDGGVYRVGGDNFTAIFEKEDFEIIKNHLAGTKINVEVQGTPDVNIMANAGFYLCTGEETNHDMVMDKISTAIVMAKSVSKDNCFVYNEEARQRIEHRKMIESQFSKAIENEEFAAFYQPKVDIATGRIIGAEALCRWIKDGKVVPPISFIPILEQSNAICMLDFYMLDRVCRDISGWISEGREVVKVSVNLSRMHLGDDKLLEKVIGIIDKRGVPHNLIEIELTETTTDVDFGELRSIVNGLHQSGISASVDDFGIGYSSLTLIKELPWDVLKIDKSFLPDGSANDEQKSIMLRHVVSMAQGLGLECIIEGVETIDQVKLLKDINCFLAQGFYFDKPLPKEQFEQRIASQYSI